MKIKSDISAIVSGGASGLGAAVVRRLSSIGSNVTIFDKNESLGKKLAEEVGCNFEKIDIENHRSVKRGLESTRQKFGYERICVNCAGIALAEKTIMSNRSHDCKLFEKVISVNLLGAFNLSSLSALGMTTLPLLERSEERGIIIHTASIAAMEGQVGQLAYASSKAGVVGMILPMARDLAEYRIRVMGVAPGIFSTPMVENLPEKVQERLSSSIPFPKRLGQATEFADLVVHIIENSMLNGEVIRLDGATRLAFR